MIASRTSSARFVDGPYLPRPRWPDIADVLDTGTKSDREQAARLRDALVFGGSAQVDEYLGVFLTDETTPRKTVLTKKFGDNNPSVARLFEAGDRSPRRADRETPRGRRPATAPRRCCISQPQRRQITGARSRSAGCSTMTT